MMIWERFSYRINKFDLYVFSIVFLSISPIFSYHTRIGALGFVILWGSIRIFKNPSEYVLVTKNDLVLLLYAFCIFSLSLSTDIYYAQLYGLNTFSFLLFPCFFIYGYVVSKTLSFDDFATRFEKIVVFLSVVSLCIYLFVSVFPSTINYFFTYEYEGFSAKTVILLNVLIPDGQVLFRNAGVASEPGLYQLILNLALHFRLLRLKKLDLASTALIMSIVTTDSTVGIFICFVILCFNLSLRLIFMLAPVVIMSFSIIVDLFFYHLEYKLFGSVAFNGRMLPILNLIDLAAEYPLGMGSVLYTHYLEILNIGGWDSYSQLYIRYGIQGLLFGVICLFILMKESILLFFIVSVTLLSQNVFFIPFLVVLYFYAINAVKVRWGK
ncbi:hypothetical protein [Shewanella gelidii]|uniref:hypothetical protein n=1 Tax=Shewanella gelidii TaxID=1642821 RepID=UPI001664315F|nr:hypothetical protein [Shewanella gelidii]MCL1096426.1 hypothetical protein [Shewanella gelidii]